MNTKTKAGGTSQKLLTELQAAIAKAANNSCDGETAMAACMEMDRLREDLRRKVGTMDVAIDLVLRSS